jgi:hypothetical protein
MTVSVDSQLEAQVLKSSRIFFSHPLLCCSRIALIQLCDTCVFHAFYDILFMDLGLLEEEVKKILEFNYDMELENRIKTNPKNKRITSH